MVTRETYIQKVKPFFNTPVVKVFTKQTALRKISPHETGALSEQELFTLYLKRGGFPFLYNYNFNDSGTQQYLSSLYNSIVLKDISLRHNIRDIDQVLENIVYQELLRRDYTVTVGKLKDQEIDFVAKKNGQPLYLQVCYLLADVLR